MSSEPLSEETGGEPRTRYQKLFKTFELMVVTALEVLIILTVAVATVLLFVLFGNGLLTHVTRIESLGHLQPALQSSFSGVLMVLLGLELLETLKTYFSEHHIRIEVVLVVAMIAMGRHIIQVDFEHTPGLQLLGLAALILSLALGYFLVKKAHANLPPERPAV